MRSMSGLVSRARGGRDIDGGEFIVLPNSRDHERQRFPFPPTFHWCNFLFSRFLGGKGDDLRSKTRTLRPEKPITDVSELPVWNYDGSSTGQVRERSDGQGERVEKSFLLFHHKNKNCPTQWRSAQPLSARAIRVSVSLAGPAPHSRRHLPREGPRAFAPFGPFPVCPTFPTPKGVYLLLT